MGTVQFSATNYHPGVAVRKRQDSALDKTKNRCFRLATSLLSRSGKVNLSPNEEQLS
jgi:hypothetical protein